MMTKKKLEEIGLPGLLAAAVLWLVHDRATLRDGMREALEREREAHAETRADFVRYVGQAVEIWKREGGRDD